jgi:hypothetical protein
VADSTERDQKRRCALLCRYYQINPKVWELVGWPEIDVRDDPWGPEYNEPQFRELERTHNDLLRYEVRIIDAAAVNLNEGNLLGDWDQAEQRCRDALKARYPNHSIIPIPGTIT